MLIVSLNWTKMDDIPNVSNFNPAEIYEAKCPLFILELNSNHYIMVFTWFAWLHPPPPPLFSMPNVSHCTDSTVYSVCSVCVRLLCLYKTILFSTYVCRNTVWENLQQYSKQFYVMLFF